MNAVNAGVLAAGSGALGWLERLRLGFFRSFFQLLLASIALAEWGVAAWVAGQLGARLPSVLHFVGPLVIFVCNRALLTRRRSAASALVRGYAALAFTSVFAGAFLAVGEVARVLGGAVMTSNAHLTGFGGTFDAAMNVGLAAIGGLFLFGYTAGRRRLDVTHHQVPMPGLPAALDGLRVVHLSDLHIGDHLGAEELARHVERVNELAADVVCITGDLVDRAETCAWAFPVLGQLRARHSVLVTLGNHDHAAGASTVTAALQTLTPFTVLRDETVDVLIGDATLSVVGLDDLGRDWARGVTEHPALPPLSRSLRPETPWLVLSHRPDCFAQAAALGAGLVLSGHTHGGQLGLPSFGGSRVRNLAEFITRYDRGLYRIGAATLLVNRGLGFTGQPIRLFTPREIACLRLRRG